MGGVRLKSRAQFDPFQMKNGRCASPDVIGVLFTGVQ
jgi:hypothetical protein